MTFFNFPARISRGVRGNFAPRPARAPYDYCMDADAEYISEWPPPASREDQGEEDGGDDGGRVSKKPRLTSAEEEESCCGDTSWKCDCQPFLHLVQSSPSTRAEVLLAQWWKEMSGTGRSSSLSVQTHSNNPKTKLFHISRSGRCSDL